MNEYQTFLKGKEWQNRQLGFTAKVLPSFLKPFQRHLVEWSVLKGRSAIFADCGLGKGLLLKELVLTPFGWENIGSLKVNDMVIGANGQPTKVTGVFFRGQQKTYKVSFSDDTSIICDGDHLWNVKSFNDVARGKPWRTMATKDLIQTQIRYGGHGQSRTWQIPLVEPICFENKDQFIHPYILGILLGDGSIAHGSVSWCKADKFIADKVRTLLPKSVRLKKKEDGDKCPNWAILGVGESSKGSNAVLNELRRLDLMGTHSYDKFVPRDYLYKADAESRLHLLQGLMDTDGYSGETPAYASASKQLAKAVVFLVQSLGGMAFLSKNVNTFYTYKGEKKTGRPSYGVTMIMPPGINPFSLPRKANLFKTPSRGLGRWIDAIEEYGKEETVCIKVDAADGLFVIRNCIVTHNTVMELVFIENVLSSKYGKKKRGLIVAPLAVSRQTIREAKKFGMVAHHTQDGTLHDGINVTNYERLKNYHSEDFDVIVTDESGVLKNFEGKYRKEITNFMIPIPYRLLCTATPAPNDFMELGTSSEALGEMTHSQMLAMFFTNDGDSTQAWRLKGHAKKKFWTWMATWSRAIRKPSDLGFDDEEFILPPLNIQRAIIQDNRRVKGTLVRVPAKTMTEQRTVRKETIIERCERVKSLVPKDRPCVIWCHENPEGDYLAKIIKDAVQVAGCNKDEVKEKRLNAFSTGDIRVLITKPKIAGFGLNWQHCADVVYFPSYSHEAYYQAIRRCWRFGQVNTVNCSLVSAAAEERMVNSMLRKERQADEMFQGVIRCMNEVLHPKTVKNGHVPMKLPQWIKL